MARPKKVIDPEQVYKLAGMNCSYEEIAAVLKCDPKTLTNRFSQVIEKGREDGKCSLKRKQFEVAMSGNVTMLIWLGKIMLGQREPPTSLELSGKDGAPLMPLSTAREAVEIAERRLALVKDDDGKRRAS